MWSIVKIDKWEMPVEIEEQIVEVRKVEGDKEWEVEDKIENFVVTKPEKTETIGHKYPMICNQ